MGADGVMLEKKNYKIDLLENSESKYCFSVAAIYSKETCANLHK
jgi:hypothetical protein